MAVPKKDSLLVNYSTNFNTRGVSSPEDFGLSTEQMSVYTPLHVAWLAAWNTCNVEGGKSKSLVAAKNSAKANLLPYARELYAFVQSSSSVTDENKSLMGVTIRKTTPTPMPPPAMAPLVTLISVIGQTAKVKIIDATAPSKRRRPVNATGATVMSFAGATPPPAGDASWKLQGQTGQTTFNVQFDSSVGPSTPCWVVALWYNARGEYSPACSPLQVFLQGSVSSAPVAQTDGSDAQPDLKVAA